MKKIITIALALVFALTLSTGAFANAASSDLTDLIAEVEAAIGADELMALIQGFFADMDLDLDEDMPEGTSDALAEAIIGALPIDADGDLADRVAGAMSNDFVSFLAGLYCGIEEETTTRVADDDPPPPTGDSSVIAIAAFATISVAAAAAFVCLKKKEK